jgi:hypothetical protein
LYLRFSNKFNKEFMLRNGGEVGEERWMVGNVEGILVKCEGKRRRERRDFGEGGEEGW